MLGINHPFLVIEEVSKVSCRTEAFKGGQEMIKKRKVSWSIFFACSVLGASLLCGCVKRDDIAAVREILELAKEDRVEGKVRFIFNGGVESGMKEGFYFGSPGSRVEADLVFKLKDINQSDGGLSKEDNINRGAIEENSLIKE